ncbi:MAG: energy-coupling factor transporter transmembrane component T [Anaerosomatales bacterium]|nr:energy-coupling factor transporter transmembrane component T [Anaerosomatales bacterium]
MRVLSIGQYIPTDSPVHGLDPRTKLGVVALVTVALFSVTRFEAFAVLAGLLVLAVRLSRLPVRSVLRGIKAVGVILAITLAAHSLRWGSPPAGVPSAGSLWLDPAGAMTGVFFAVRIVLLVVTTSMLTLTTSPVALADGLERLMRPLAVFGVPVGDVAMMLTVALRFIPTTAYEAEQIMMAQAARGARFDQGGPIRRAKALVPVLVPLFVNLFRRADVLAIAMESRCYTSGRRRTRMKELVMRTPDWFVLIGSAVLCVGLALVM